MGTTIDAIDITDRPDLIELVDEVRATGSPRLLRRGNEDVAVITPIAATATYPWRQPTAADYEAFRSAAGGWKDFDADQFIKENYQSRRCSARPLVDL